MKNFIQRFYSKFPSLKTWFGNFIDAKDGDSKSNLYYIFISAFILVLIVLIIGIFLKVIGINSGEFGDFFGGILNPLLSFLTLMGLLITIVLQQSELRETRIELRRSASALENQINAIDRQNFENTFFQMLNLHNNIVNSIDLHYGKTSPTSSSREKIGRDCFKSFYDNYKRNYNKSSGELRERLQQAYDSFWDRRQQDLAHYYRYLYNVLRFVHEHEGKIDKFKYIRLLRAQLSDYELALLFYTALNRNGIRYSLYIHEYMIFDNLPIKLLIEPEHKKLYSDKSYGTQDGGQTSEIWPPRVLSDIHESKKS